MRNKNCACFFSTHGLRAFRGSNRLKNWELYNWFKLVFEFGEWVSAYLLLELNRNGLKLELNIIMISLLEWQKPYRCNHKQNEILTCEAYINKEEKGLYDWCAMREYICLVKGSDAECSGIRKPTHTQSVRNSQPTDRPTNKPTDLTR